MSVEVSVLVVSYNTREMTLECLRSVFTETTETSFEVIVVDNASSDGSAEAIKREFGDRIRLVSSQENLGFAAANNLAAEHARGEYLLLLNPDTEVLDDAIGRLLDRAKRCPHERIWGGRTVFANGSLNPASCWNRQTLWSLTCQALGLSSVFRRSTTFNPEAIGGWDRSTERCVDIVSGCFLLIRTALWRQLGGFDTSFFMYGEEADLCLRARELGVSSAVCPEAVIVHHGGASEAVRADKMCRLMAAKMSLIKRHFPTSTRRLGQVLFLAWPFSRMLGTGIVSMFRGGVSPRARTWREVWHRRCEWATGYPCGPGCGVRVENSEYLFQGATSGASDARDRQCLMSPTKVFDAQ